MLVNIYIDAPVYIEGRARPTFEARAILRLCNGGVSWRQQNGAERPLAFDFKTTAESRPEKYGRPRHSQRAAGGPTTSFQNNVRCSFFGICVEEEEEEIIQGRRKKIAREIDVTSIGENRARKRHKGDVLLVLSQKL